MAWCAEDGAVTCGVQRLSGAGNREEEAALAVTHLSHPPLSWPTARFSGRGVKCLRKVSERPWHRTVELAAVPRKADPRPLPRGLGNEKDTEAEWALVWNSEPVLSLMQGLTVIPKAVQAPNCPTHEGKPHHGFRMPLEPGADGRAWTVWPARRDSDPLPGSQSPCVEEEAATLTAQKHLCPIRHCQALMSFGTAFEGQFYCCHQKSKRKQTIQAP